jgi:murein DD-endopeptidase MepM/ murein hydrolase activator NlpD
MRFRLKHYQNRFKLRFSESYYIWKRKYKKRWDEFLEKGHEKMTVMFIPHTEKNIFTFQISKFFITFFVLLFLVILITSSYAIIKNTSIKREERRLMMNYKDIRAHLLRFEKYTNSIAGQVDEVKPDIEELYERAAGNEGESDRIWESTQTEDSDNADIKKLKHILPEEIFTLRELQKDFLCATRAIKTVKNFIDVRSKVINDTPSIIPNRGHITSLFGWRRSPFGFGRDFHSGIDIAASGGTEIRATAPGEVIASGWGGGYGYRVHLKHKYGFETVYGHCSRLAVTSGDYVKKGEVVAYVGQTGAATGNHCHYEIRLGNVAINPYPYMRKVW